MAKKERRLYLQSLEYDGRWADAFGNQVEMLATRPSLVERKSPEWLANYLTKRTLKTLRAEDKAMRLAEEQRLLLEATSTHRSIDPMVFIVTGGLTAIGVCIGMLSADINPYYATLSGAGILFGGLTAGIVAIPSQRDQLSLPAPAIK